MMRLIVRLLLLLTVLLVTGCPKDYSFPKAVYEGVQTQNQLQASPPERGGKLEPLTYQQYEAERNRPQ